MTPEALTAIQARADAATQWHGISHEARGNTCINAWPCPTALLAKDVSALLDALRGSEADNARLRDALETITRELDQTIVWRRTSGMRPATDISMFASTALSACLRLQRTLAALAEPSAEGGGNND